MFTTRIGIRQPVVERGTPDVNVNFAHADMPAHGVPVPAVIITIVASSGNLSSFAPAVFAGLWFVGVPLASVELYRFSFLQFQVR
jgi:hypothetical protein